MTTATRELDLSTLRLAKGAHSPDGVFCVMEAAAYIAGEPWSDHPACVSPVIAEFCRSWNDELDDKTRQILVPIIPRLIGTATTAADETTRAWLATDWLVRTFAPAWLRLAGLTSHADALEGLDALTTADLARKAQKVIAAARDATRAAAWAAARAATRDAARAAAWAAGRTREAMDAALAPTVATLQRAALDLLERMCAVGREAAA